jgi:peroxiredoxin
MAQLREDYAAILERRAEVIVIGPEDEAAFKEFWQREKMPFPGIADPRHVIARLYGQEIKILKMGRMPSLFIIDRQGMVRFQHHGKSMSDIPADRDVLEMLSKIDL